MSKVKPKSLKKAKNSNRPKSRKEVRKENRKLKKQKRSEYYNNRKKPGKTDLKPSNLDLPPNKIATNQIIKAKRKQIEKDKPAENDRFGEVQKERRKEEKLKKEMVLQRTRQLQDANVDEDRNIKRLEKQLKLNKRKSKAIPKSFVSEGLDYLLEVCDDNIKNIASTEQQFNEVNDEFEEDFELMAGGPIKRQKVKEADDDVTNSDLDESEESHDENKEYSSENDDLKEDISNEDSDTLDNREGSEKIELNEDGTWEDIYGRLRSQDGSVVANKQESEEAKYVPPALRTGGNQKSKERLTRLIKQLKGLFNRLAEANMHSISNQVEELYMNNSRNDMNGTITKLMIESLASNTPTPERLLLEHVMLIAILHANVGTEIGAHFLQEIVKHFDKLFNTPQEIENKTLDNVVNIISQLYNFKVFDARLLYDILSKLSGKFDEKSVECILSILRNVGFSLRKDDPLALKSLILDLQKQAANITEEMKDNSRVKFMLDILLAIKNNNVAKIPNYDTTYSEHLKKIMKSFIRKGNYVTQLKISLDDLLKADTRGKWWIVGSAWTGNIENIIPSTNIPKSDQYSQKLLNLARKHHMNTDTRRNIFCVIMSAEDYLDAFEKLLRLGLKNQQEREIVHVILHCCLQEKKFNPYYAVVAQKFCDHDRKFQLTIKFSVWDKLNALAECSATQLSNLAKMLTHLFLEKALPISTLKIVQFSELDKITLRFLRQVLLGVLLADDADACVQVFDKVSQSDKLKMFRESLRLFILHFLLKNLDANTVPEAQKVLLKERAGMVEKMLSVSERKSRFPQ